MATGSTEIVCLSCGKQFTRHGSRFKTPKYCSRECSGDAREALTDRMNRDRVAADVRTAIYLDEVAPLTWAKPIVSEPERATPSCLGDPDCKREVVVDGVCARHAALEALI